MRFWNGNNASLVSLLKTLILAALLICLFKPLSAQTLLEVVQSARTAAAEGRKAEAISLYDQAVSAISDNTEADANTAFLQNELSTLYRSQDNIEAAVITAEDAVRRALNAKVEPTQLAIYRYNLALALFDQAKYEKAIITFNQALIDIEDLLNSPLEHNILRERGKALQVVGLFDQAISDFTQSLRLVETSADPQHQLNLLQLMTATHLVAGDVGQARLTIDKVSDDAADSKTQVLRARVLIAEGALGEAETLLNQVLNQSDSALQRASAHYNLAEIHFSRGDYPSSARSNLKAQSLFTEAFGPDHYALNQTAHRQAILLQETGDYASSLDIFTASQTRTAALFGTDHPTWVATEIERSSTLVKLGRLDEALVSLRNLTSRELSERSNILARSALGLRYYEDDRPDEAFEVLKPVVAQWQTGVYGLADAPPTMVALADIYALRSEWGQGTEIINDAIKLLSERGANSIDRLSEARRIKAQIHLGQGDTASALPLINANLDTAAEQIANLALTSGYGVNYAPSQIRKQVEQATQLFWSQSGTGPIRALNDDMFRAMQLVHLNETSAAALDTFSASQGQFAPLLTTRQDLLDRLRVLQSRHLAILRKDQSEAEESATELLQSIDALEAELNDLDGQLRRQAPDVMSYLSPAPASLDDVQSNLGPTEALWLHTALEQASYVTLITAKSARVYETDVTGSHLSEMVQRLRKSVSFRQTSSLPDFDVKTAAKLYDLLIDPLLSDAPETTTFYAIPDGALQQVSLAILVMGRRDGGTPSVNDGIDVLRYFGHEVALAHLPSPQLLILQSQYSKASAEDGLVGFGDPVFEGTGTVDTRAMAETFDKLSGLAKPDLLRSNLQPLPLTRVELETIQVFADVEDVRLFLGDEANETRVRTTNYKDVDTLIFATHALVAGEFTDLAEPAIVLTPPNNAHPSDDGLLLASEIMELDLNARLVILSACNTGSSSGRPGASGLSGLARAFWVAGAENMMVSHWEVSSSSTAAITPRMFLSLKNAPEISTAEALRRAMVGFVENTNDQAFTHPAHWGAFSIIGKG
jgi:CHAT domain-containing protein